MKTAWETISWTPFCHPNIKKCAIQTELKICFIFFWFVLNKTVKYNMDYIAIASLKKITLFSTNAFHENINTMSKTYKNLTKYSTQELSLYL